MYFTNINDFIAMGKHGFFVWSAYLITLIAIIAIHLITSFNNKKLKKKLSDLNKNLISNNNAKNK